MSTRVVIATRESRLAMWQAEHVQRLLRARLGIDAQLLGLTTRGDQILDRALSKIGGKGLFVKELETALADGRAQLAVHSLKDVPMALADGFVLGAVLEREDARDAFVSPRHATLQQLPQGACVGTSSLRRAAQLLSLRPDLRIEPLRGNLDTRLRRLDDGGYDAIVLAAAGLLRLGLGARIRTRFDPAQLTPAAGQGALGLEWDERIGALGARLATLAHPPTQLATAAERAVARALGGSCSMPLAAHAVWQGAELELQAMLGHALQPGQPVLRTRQRAAVGDEAAAQALGERAAAALRAADRGGYLRAAAALGSAAADD